MKVKLWPMQMQRLAFYYCQQQAHNRMGHASSQNWQLNNLEVEEARAQIYYKKKKKKSKDFSSELDQKLCPDFRWPCEIRGEPWITKLTANHVINHYQCGYFKFIINNLYYDIVFIFNYWCFFKMLKFNFKLNILKIEN